MAHAYDEYTWFVEPKNEYTNLVLAGFLPEENFCQDQTVEDGLKVPLWRMERWRQVDYLLSNAENRFYLYVRQGPNGKIRRMDFMAKQKKGATTREKIEQAFANLGLKAPRPQTA
ncbi:MAG: hypothetical protein WCO55_04920 [Candidatus Falkowbacteria bacterium]